MARQWRISFPGALYHILSRGNGRQDIFLSDDDRHLFLSLLSELSERFHIDIFAYVLMGNHYHLLVRTNEANISRAMQWFGTTYTRKFNINNHRDGHLFQGRYNSIVVQNDAYLLRLSCYIHRNPLRAGITERLADYRWSSYRYYAYRKKTPEWLKTRFILDQLSSEDPHKAYRTKVQHYSKEEGRFLEDVKHRLIYGSQDFVSEIKKRFLEEEKNVELPQQNSIFRDVDIQSLAQKAAFLLGLKLETLCDQRKVCPAEKDNRDMLVYLIWKTGRFSNREIGSCLGLTYSAISQRVKIMNSKIMAEKKLRDKYQLVKSQIKV